MRGRQAGLAIGVFEDQKAASVWIEREADALRSQIEQHDRDIKEQPIEKYTRLAIEYGVDLLRLRLLERVLDARDDPEGTSG
jgi:hypothetical protein